MLYYLAYGSNLHPSRLTDRIASAQPIAIVEIPDRAVLFIKRSIDGSSKCSITRSPLPGETAWGILYTISEQDIDKLNRYEGLGKGYQRLPVEVETSSGRYDAFTYVVSSTHYITAVAPYDWYKEFVLVGAAYFSFPADYITKISSCISKSDEENSRRMDNESKLQIMRATPSPTHQLDRGVCHFTS